MSALSPETPVTNQPGADQDLRATGKSRAVGIERVFKRFTLGQRWEHGFLIITFTLLLLTGLPQKYFNQWGYLILTTPERLMLVRNIHHISAVILMLEVLYHLAHNFWLMIHRKLSGEIFPSWQDVRDAWQMLKYLLFITNKKPAFGKYNFEQKFTYWFLFVAIGIMVGTGLILWFPLVWTRILPGGVVPASLLAHSDEAVIAGIFVVIWHFYHVHFQRLNLSIFNGRLNERDEREYHQLEYERLMAESAVLDLDQPSIGQSDLPVTGDEMLEPGETT
jgi:cytochrome b subunit of formate dehydrogenase